MFLLKGDRKESREGEKRARERNRRQGQIHLSRETGSTGLLWHLGGRGGAWQDQWGQGAQQGRNRTTETKREMGSRAKLTLELCHS